MAKLSMKMTDRQLAFLRALADSDARLHSAAVFAKAFPDEGYVGRRDAGANKTLLGLEMRGLVNGTYVGLSSLMWKITDKGREVLDAG